MLHVPANVHLVLPPAISDQLRQGLSKCGSTHALPDDVRTAISTLCQIAKVESWTPEQLVVALKDACFASRELSRIHASSEREAIVARIVTFSIREYYRAPVNEPQ